MGGQMNNLIADNTSFVNPPLIELIIELRWLPSAGGDMNAALIKHEELFKLYADKISEEGYTQFERLIPSGFPVMVNQPVCRYKKKASDKDTTLYQLGLGIFSINVTPPYISWKVFKPVVEKGIKLFLESCSEIKLNDQEFINIVNMRYINAFQDNLTKGESLYKFINETLGINIGLPNVLKELVSSQDEIKPFLRLSIPLKSEHQEMTLGLGEGLLNNNRAIIMDIIVSTTKNISSDTNEIIIVLEMAQANIHNTFMKLTEKLHLLMNLDGG